jgi:elongator complex protein 3
LRLRISNPSKPSKLEFPILHNRGLIRELHIYGDLVPIHKSKTHAAQHHGFGRRLLKHAEKITYSYNLAGTAVISGIGVKLYYQKHGYTHHSTYMIKDFFITKKYKDILIYFISILVLLYCIQPAMFYFYYIRNV